MSSCRREGVRRRVVRTLNACSPAAALGPLEHGMEVLAVHKGQWPLMELVEHLLDQAGPADVTVSTWAVVTSDLDTALRLLRHGHLRSCRWLVDRSFPQRQPGYCQALRERFGDTAIVVTSNHAKVVLVRNERWSLVVRTSMNISPKSQIETWEVSDSRELAEYVEGVVMQAAATAPALRARELPSLEDLLTYD